MRHISILLSIKKEILGGPARSLLQELSAEGIFQDTLSLAKCCDLIIAGFFAIHVSAVAFATSWLEVLQVLENCIEFTCGVLERLRHCIEFSLDGFLLDLLCPRISLGLCNLNFLCLHVLVE